MLVCDGRLMCYVLICCRAFLRTSTTILVQSTTCLLIAVKSTRQRLRPASQPRPRSQRPVASRLHIYQSQPSLTTSGGVPVSPRESVSPQLNLIIFFVYFSIFILCLYIYLPKSCTVAQFECKDGLYEMLSINSEVS